MIWSDRTFARKEELNYFKDEISKGDIAVLNLPVWNHLVSLSDRLQLNGIGRAVPHEDANPTAGYLMFYCVSSNSQREYLSCRQNYFACEQKDSNRAASLLKIEKFINENIMDEIDINERVAIINTYGNFLHPNIIEKYLTNFTKVRCLKYRVGNIKMYKVIFKCTENLLGLKNFPERRELWCFLQKVDF